MQHVDLTKARWRKSSRCDNSGPNCVEVATNLPGIVAVRDSKNPQQQPLMFDRGEWDAFVAGAKNGEFDLS